MKLVRLGFTGTQLGMDEAQKKALTSYLGDLLTTGYSHLEIHHGDCIGADAEFHEIATQYWPSGKVRVVIHPPEIDSKRAWVDFKKKRTMAPRPYLERNRAIVDSSDFMVAAPKGLEEELRSGTWATIRYARKTKKQIHMLWISP